MNLYYNLPQEDKKQIDSYISLLAQNAGYHNNYVSSKEFLKEWSNQKQRLYKLFDNQFRIEIDMPKKTSFDTFDYTSIQAIGNYSSNSFFVTTVSNLLNQSSVYWSNIFHDLVNPIVLWNKKIDTKLIKNINYNIDLYKKVCGQSLCFSVSEGMSVFKVIKRFLHITKIDNNFIMEEFEKWRTHLSFLTMNNQHFSKIVLSIHPIDFLTLSDNNCNWTSCYSTLNQGCHCSSTVTMMNSKLAMVAYLENSNNVFDVEGVGIIPNKKWRSLFFVDKNLLLSGVAYPYPEDNIQKVVLKELKKRVAEKFHWYYKYNYEPYTDTLGYQSNANLYIKGVGKKDYQKQKILVRTPRGTYNDFVTTQGYTPLCCRNNVSCNKVINLGGRRTSMLDGETTRYFSDPCMAGDKLFF